MFLAETHTREENVSAIFKGIMESLAAHLAIYGNSYSGGLGVLGPT